MMPESRVFGNSCCLPRQMIAGNSVAKKALVRFDGNPTFLQSAISFAFGQNTMLPLAQSLPSSDH